MRARTLVIGGGLAGLLAARRRQRAGDQVVLLEAERTVGGAIAGTDLAGLAVNAGAEAYSTASGAVDTLLEELGLAERIVSPRQQLGSRVVSASGAHRAPGASLLGIPAHPLAPDAREVLGTAGALRASLERFLPASYGNRPGVTVDALVRKRLGAAVAERLVAPVVGGVHSADPAALEFAAASPVLSAGLSRDGSLTRAVRRARGRSRASAGTRVHALAPTMELLPRTLHTRILEAGGIIRTAVTASGVEHDPQGTWTVRTAAGERLDVDHLVLACPPDAARELLLDADPGIAEAIPQAPSARVRLVALLLDAPALDDFPSGTGALVAPGTPGIGAKALTHATAKWEHVQRLAREALPGAASPHLVRLSYGRPGEELPDRDGIVDRALADASRILGTELGPSQLLDTAVIDWDRAMRQALPGHRAALDALDDLLTRRPRLELVGSWRAGTGIDAIVRADAAAQTPPSTEGPDS